MPKWPAGLLFAATTACAYPAATNPPPGEESVYRALGQEPGWTVTITGERIDYAGDYGETRITVPRPDPRATFNGHRYETERLIVDATHVRCNDTMSGHGYADTVMVIRSEEHTSELQSLMRISSAVFCLKKNKQQPSIQEHTRTSD